MTREQAINYLISSGFTHEQVGDVVRALTYEPARLSVEEVTALAEWTAKLTKASEDAYNKGYADGMKAQEPITSKDKFIYGLTACGCLLKDGKTWYEHNELIKCFEDLGLFEQEPILDKIRAEIDQLSTTTCTETHRIYIDVDDFKENVLAILDKYKAESEEV